MFERMAMNTGQWRNFKFDFWAASLFSVFNVVFFQFYLPMAIHAGATDMQVGWLAAAPAIGLLFTPLWAGWIERRPHPLRFVVVPNLIARVLIIIPAFFGTPIVYVIVALLFHMMMGIHSPAYASLMTRIYPTHYRGRLMSYVRISMSVLMIPTAYFIGVWMDHSGAQGPLLVGSLFGLLSIWAFAMLRETEPIIPNPQAKQKFSLSEQWSLVRENRHLSTFLIATTLAGFANILVQPLYQIIQVNRLSLTFEQIGIARTVYFVALLVAFFLVGYLVDRFKPFYVIAMGIFAFGIGPLAYGLSESFTSVLIGSVAQGVGDAIWDIGFLVYIMRIAPGREAVVFGLHLMLFGIRGTIGPLLATSLTDVVPYATMLLSASGIAMLGALIFIIWNRNES